MTSIRRRTRRGQAIVLMALAMVAICGMMALAIDAGRLFFQRRLMQDAVDAGALAGAQALVGTVANPNGAVRTRLVETRVRFKHISRDELDKYLGAGEWKGKAGGYAVQGLAGVFVVKLVGSYTNVVGLPLYETMSLLGGERYPLHFGWLNAV